MYVYLLLFASLREEGEVHHGLFSGGRRVPVFLETLDSLFLETSW